jgi:hypothetical protein
MKRTSLESGQALVLVLLSLAVVLTIVLFIIGRSVTDIAISGSESQAVSAFSAAEAGVEQALVIGAGTSATIGDASYTAQITNVAQGVSSFVYPVELNSGDSITLWFKSQDGRPNFTGNTLKICWAKAGTAGNSAVTPAIEASVIYETSAGNPATSRVYRAAYDPNSGRSPSNSFTSAGGGATIAGQVFPFCNTLSLAGLTNLQFATIRMFYNSNTAHPVGFDSTNGALFPTQGVVIDSAGKSGQSSRSVQVFQGWPEVPPVFLSGVYSSSGLTK